MESGSYEGYRKILNSYKLKNKRVLVITKSDFVYSCEVIEIYSDGFLFQDKFGKEILLSFSEIKQLGGSGSGNN